MISIDKGITLIALIITIIVLLILAGVTVAMVVGNNGLLSKAFESKEKTVKAQYIEALKLAALESEEFEGIKIACQKNSILDNANYIEYLDYKLLIVETKEKYQFLVTKTKVLETRLLNIESGSIDIYPDYYLQNGEKNKYNGKGFVITGSTMVNSINIFGNDSNTYSMSVLDLSIDVHSISDVSAFNIKEGANINLELIGTNIFKSGSKCAGLQKSNKKGTLTIDGTGTLTANGGEHSAGIGGGATSANVSSCTNIIINNGTINANSGNLGPGIGAGYFGSAVVDNIQINGGIINAVGNNAGIGTGRRGSAVSNIKITGGKITARSWYESVGIGGANLSNVEISGGTLNITGYNTFPAISGRNGITENIIINGGNVYLYSTGSVIVGSTNTSVSPISQNNEDVLKTVLTLNGVSSEIIINNIEFSDYSGTYGLKDMYTRTNGKVYLYLPVGAKVVSLTVGEDKYVTENPIEAGSEGILQKQ